MTKDGWAGLKKKLQFRAFTMAKLGTATEIETAKQILAAAVEKGETYAESWQTLKDSLGGNPSFKPGYWETVFRTNTQSAYTAGKLEKYADTGAVAYQLMVVEDERTSKICRHLLVESGYGAILPVGHRFWQKYGFPPYHFNCRTSVCPIYSSQVAKTGYIVEDIPMNRFAKFKPQKGFGGNPLDRGSWWEMTDSMKKQAVKFGLMDLFSKERKMTVKPKEKVVKLAPEQNRFPKNTAIRINVENMKKDGDYFDFAAHGTSTGIQINGKMKNAEEIAEIIKKDPRFSAEKGVRLVSCSTGQGRKCIAQEIANILHCEVKAPNDLIYVNPDGTYRIGYFGLGDWRIFEPKE